MHQTNYKRKCQLKTLILELEESGTHTLFTTIKQTLYNDNIFAQTNLYTRVGGVLDKQYHNIQLPYLMQLSVISSHAYTFHIFFIKKHESLKWY